VTTGSQAVQMQPGMYAGGMAPRGRKMYRADLAELAGISVRSLGRAKLPEPDGVVTEAGHARPWWWESTAQAWLEARPGKGWRKGAAGSSGE
jgi:hypothetical protein